MKNMKMEQEDEIIYLITMEDLQHDAVERIGRELSDDEVRIAKKCIEYGLSCVIGITLKTAIEEAIDKTATWYFLYHELNYFHAKTSENKAKKSRFDKNPLVC